MYSLLEQLLKVTEVVAISLSAPEQKLKNYYKDRPKYSQLDFGGAGEIRFWILGDGTVIRVWEESHAETATEAGVGYEALLDSGACRGYSIKSSRELGIEGRVEFSSAQKKALLRLVSKHMPELVYVDYPGKGWSGSAKQLDYFLTYGVDEAKSDGGKLLEKLIGEAVATAVDPQKAMKQYYKKVLNTKLTKSTWPSDREENQYKFWLLQDGTVIPVTYSHAKTVFAAGVKPEGVSGRDFMETGAVAGYFSLDADEMGVDCGKKLTSRQVAKLKNLYLDYKVPRLLTNIPGNDVDSPIKSLSHLDYLLTYGLDVDEAKSGEDEKEQFFVDRTEKHISLVQGAAAKIVGAYPEFDELLKQVEVHDQSKLEEPERTPYVEITWRHKLENEKGEYDPYNGKGYQTPGKLEKKEENEATIHHITTNSHHPEYHLEDKSDANVDMDDRSKSELVDASLMPDIDVAEMVADWQAMSEELQTNTAREWFDKQKDVRWHFSEKQEELIDKLLKVFEE